MLNQSTQPKESVETQINSDLSLMLADQEQAGVGRQDFKEPIVAREVEPVRPNDNIRDINPIFTEESILEDQKPRIFSEMPKEEEMTPVDQLSGEDKIEFQFENASLELLINQIADLWKISFITDDAFNPLPLGTRSVKGTKITFKTNRPLTRDEAWDLFVTFLDISGFAILPEPQEDIYRITITENARKSPLPTFIGIDPELLPDSDQIIRYVYFVENSSIEAIKTVVDVLKSAAAPALALQDHKAFLITDKAYNIKNLMGIVKELDRVVMPQALSVLKLHKAEATDVKALYESLISQEAAGGPRIFQPRKSPSSTYFPENVKLIAEPRTNSLILMGAQDAIKKIEDFIINHVDVDLAQPYSPLYVYQLKYADVQTVADIMNNITKFGNSSEAGRSGGIRGSDKFLKPMSFTPEPDTNQLVIKGDYTDYLAAKEIIDKLDESQPQVAVEVLILGVTLLEQKELGAQLRSKVPGTDGLLGDNVRWQTSGLFYGVNAQGIEENQTTTSGSQRLLGNLVNLVLGAPAGNTVVSLGADAFGVWGIFQALQTISNAQIISNPFIVATNKTQAKVEVGEIRRVITGQVVGQQTVNSFGNFGASLKVEISPQINSDGMIVLDIKVTLESFIGGNSDPNNAQKTVRKIETQTIVADKEVIALGGLIRNEIDENVSKTPVLGDIPVIGWLFKNRHKGDNKQNLLVLISSRIIEPGSTQDVASFTQGRVTEYQTVIDSMHDISEKRDPVYKVFFQNKSGQLTDHETDELIFRRHEYDKIANGTVNNNPASKSQRYITKLNKKAEAKKTAIIEKQVGIATRTQEATKTPFLKEVPLKQELPAAFDAPAQNTDMLTHNNSQAAKVAPTRKGRNLLNWFRGSTENEVVT